MTTIAESPKFYEIFRLNQEQGQTIREQFAPQIGDVGASFVDKKGHQIKGSEITAIYDLQPWLRVSADIVPEDLRPHYDESIADIKTTVLLDLKPVGDSDPLLHNRRAVLMETMDGKRAIFAVALYDDSPSGWWFGGEGNYKIDENAPSQLAFCMDHSDKLARTMTRKAYEIGADWLRGTKVIVGGDDWKVSQTLQTVNGMLFSESGPFPNVITGSDVGQTEITIANMELGSRMLSGGETKGQIVGSEHGLKKTAEYARHTMQHSYEALRALHPATADLPSFADLRNGVLVQALGKIGHTTAEMLLDEGAPRLYITDIALFPELYPQVTPEVHASAMETLNALKQKATPHQEIIVVKPDEVWEQTVDVFCPCSSEEGIITYERGEQMAANGVRVILSGANNPFEEPEVASVAEQRFGILTPPEILSNGGSATSAALETRYLQHRAEYSGPDDYVHKVLIPHIQVNAQQKMAELVEISREQGVPLYQAGEVAYERWHNGQH